MEFMWSPNGGRLGSKGLIKGAFSLDQARAFLLEWLRTLDQALIQSVQNLLSSDQGFWGGLGCQMEPKMVSQINLELSSIQN